MMAVNPVSFEQSQVCGIMIFFNHFFEHHSMCNASLSLYHSQISSHLSCKMSLDIGSQKGRSEPPIFSQRGADCGHKTYFSHEHAYEEVGGDISKGKVLKVF